MRKRLSIGTGVAASAILAATLAPVALTHGDGGGRSLQLSSSFAQDGFVDAAPVNEANPGDAYAFGDDLFRDGRKIGDRGGVCTLVRVEPPTAVSICADTYRLPEGQITAQGLITFDLAVGATDYTLAVTGGTGAYRGVGGEVRTVETNAGQDGTHTFRLVRSD